MVILFFVLMAAVFGRLTLFAVRCAWGLSKVLLTLVFLPIILILSVVFGLLKLALPLLIVFGILSLILPQFRGQKSN